MTRSGVWRFTSISNLVFGGEREGAQEIIDPL